MQRAIEQRHAFVRRNYIHAVWLYFKPVACLVYLHERNALQELGHDANVVRVEMLNHHEGHPAVFGHIGKELFQCFEPAGGGADTYDGKLSYFIFAGGGGDVIDLESFTNFLDIDFCVFMEDGFTKTSLFQEVI